MKKLGKRRWLLIAAIVVIACAGAYVGYVVWWPEAETPPGEVSRETASIDLAQRPLAAIPPGAVIGDGPPEGWTHLVIKSDPRVADDSKGIVSDGWQQRAGMLITTILAKVEPPTEADAEGGHRLADIAAGLAMDLDGTHTIVSTKTADEQGLDLGMLGNVTLDGGEKHLGKMRCVARTRTMAVLDAPTWLLVDGEHREAVLRYVLLVDPAGGELETLVWALLTDGNDPPALDGPLGEAQWLPRPCVTDCELHVDSSKVLPLVGTPRSESTFAVTQIPQGRTTFKFSDKLRPLAAAASWSEEEIVELQQRLVELVSRPPVE